MVEWSSHWRGGDCGKSRFGREHQGVSFEMPLSHARGVKEAGLCWNKKLEERSGACIYNSQNRTKAPTE